MTVRLGGGVKGAFVEVCRETVSGGGSFFTVFVHSAVNRLWRPKMGERRQLKTFVSLKGVRKDLR